MKINLHLSRWLLMISATLAYTVYYIDQRAERAMSPRASAIFLAKSD